MLSDVGEISGRIVGKPLCKPRVHKIGDNNAVGIYCHASRTVMVEHSRRAVANRENLFARRRRLSRLADFLYFSRRGYQVLAIDNFAKRREAQCGVRPLQSIPPLSARIERWRTVARRKTTGPIRFQHCDLSEDYELLAGLLQRFRPDALVHFAEQPSAPFSMACRENAIETQRNNVLGTLNLAFAMREACPDAHLVKLGTMGEYGTPNIDIEEGWLEVEHNGRRDRVLYPKRPGSLYHLSKVHDAANLAATRHGSEPGDGLRPGNR